jgi:hypothetical protein
MASKENLLDFRTDKTSDMLPRSIALTDSEIDSLRTDLRQAVDMAQKRWGKIHTTKHLHPKV